MATAIEPAASRRTALLAEYAEVNSNFRLLTNIRFKLLAILPLAPAAAVVITATVASDRPNAFVEARTLALCLFGLVVTMGLASYNARNDQVYLWHIERAASIERQLGLGDGSFANRPNAWFDIPLMHGRWRVGHSSSVTAIYSSSIALWLLAALVAGAQLVWGSSRPPGWVYVVAIPGAVLVTTLGGGYVRCQQRRRRQEIGEQARLALEQADRLLSSTDHDPCLPDWQPFVEACVRLSSKERSETERREEVTRRIKFYGRLTVTEREQHMGPTSPGVEPAARYVTLIVDLPPSWIAVTPHGRTTASSPNPGEAEIPPNRRKARQGGPFDESG
jgi:hypothetical protein